jgi:HK97 family phage major capsid protein
MTDAVHEVLDLIQKQGESFKEFKATYERRFADFEKKAGRPSFGANADSGFSADDIEHRKAFLGWMRSGQDADLRQKAMSTISGPDGGYLMPSQLDSELTKTLRELSPMRRLARGVKVESGDYSMLHSVGGTGASWVGEKQARPETASPNFQKISPVVGEVYSNPGVTQTMLDDAGFDLEGWLLDELSESFDAAEGAAFATGDGINKPRGFLTYDTANTADGTRADTALQYVPTGASGAFAASAPADKLVTLVHSLKPRYRAGAAWLMNTNTLEQVRTMKNSSGDYLWKQTDEAQQIGATGTLLGYPLFEDENIPDIAAGSLSIAFGNFQRGYTVVDRSTQMLRDPYSSKPYVHFYTSRRVGGAVRDTRAIKLMKFAAS